MCVLNWNNQSKLVLEIEIFTIKIWIKVFGESFGLLIIRFLQKNWIIIMSVLRNRKNMKWVCWKNGDLRSKLFLRKIEIEILQN